MKAYREEHDRVAGEGTGGGDGVGAQAETDEADDELQDANGDEARRVFGDVLHARSAFTGAHCGGGLRVSEGEGDGQARPATRSLSTKWARLKKEYKNRQATQSITREENERRNHRTRRTRCRVTILVPVPCRPPTHAPMRVSSAGLKKN